MRLIDRYILRLTLWPLLGALGVTLVALLLERVLRLLQMLSDSSHRFGFVAELAANLVPHYLGLTLPAGFFIALFVVVTRLNQDSEIDALLASGVSLTRLVAPCLGLAALLTLVSLILFGFLQPYSRYAYRAVLHEAQTAGWNGLVQPQTFLSPDRSLTLTADGVDPTGEKLRRLFIREVRKDGREQITTAAAGKLTRASDGKTVTLQMQDGQQLTTNGKGQPRVLTFRSSSLQMPLGGAERLLRGRGGDERELTLSELIAKAGDPHSVIPHQTLMAELCGRLARTFCLPLLPLLAFPLGLAAKRGGRAPGIVMAGLLLLLFQHLLSLGQSLTANGRTPAVLGVGAPFLVFTVLCIGMFVSSRKRPGETPISLLSERIGEAIRRMTPHRKPKAEAAA